MTLFAYLNSFIAVKILLGLFVLGVLIFVHELGHFLLAKFFRVGVLEFAIGFGKVIWQKRIGETKYSLRLIPLGGYVRMVGDDPRNYTKSGEPGPGFEIQAVGDLSPEQQAMVDDRTRWLLERSFWPKFLIVFAGPAFNIIFAWLLAVGVYGLYGRDEPIEAPVTIELLHEDFPAEQAGMQDGDIVSAVNGQPVADWKEFLKAVEANAESAIALDVIRKKADAEESLKFNLVPQEQSQEMALLTGSKDKKRMLIGVRPAMRVVDVPLSKALSYGTIHVVNMASLSVRSLYWLVSGQVSAKNISGPIAIVDAASKSADRGLQGLVLFMIFLSVSLAVLNLLPIPVLDGGHILFFIVETVIGGPVSLKTQERATAVGMIFILALTVFAISNDILKFFQ